MMTKKSEMAEWILNFFRDIKAEAGHVVMLRVIDGDMNRTYNLNDYFTYEEGQVQCFRLTEKGYKYIYDENAVLDCCQDVWKPTRAQSKYIANWHDSFVNYVNQLLAAVVALEMQPQATDAGKQGINALKLLLNGKDVEDVESDLAQGVVSQATLDKIEKLNKDLGDIAIDHIDANPLWKQFLKQLYNMKVESDKAAEMMRLKALQIPVL